MANDTMPFPYGLGCREPAPVPTAKRRPMSVPAIQKRMYQSAKSTRMTTGFGTSVTSADTELASSLTALRSRSRQLVRDASYAKRARTLVVNNVIGWSGIGLQAQVKTNGGQLVGRINDEIEEVWEDWCKATYCHTGGRLHFADFERQLMGQVFEAGEVLVRFHYTASGGGTIPLTLELIEAERLADEFAQPGPAFPGNTIRMGVEVDKWHRPQAYWIRGAHPGELRWTMADANRYERVPATDIIHLAVIDRWPQTRGEPWMHTAARRLNDMDGYSEAEIIRARAQAVRIGIIETPEDTESLGEEQDDGTFEAEYEPGEIFKLNPGEKWHDNAPTAPNPQLDPFMRYMLREVAAGVGPSYESISRDYSQSNYSSSRLALLDDRDLWKFYQWWFIRDFRQRLHAVWFQQAMLSKAIATISLEAYAANPLKFSKVRYKPRGWTWIDPPKEVDAFIRAIEAGFMTVGDVIAQTGGGQDLEEVLTARLQELELMRSKGLVFTTSPEFYQEQGRAPIAPPQDEEPPGKPGTTVEGESTEPPPKGRLFSFPR